VGDHAACEASADQSQVLGRSAPRRERQKDRMILPTKMSLGEYIGALKAQEKHLVKEGKDTLMVSSTIAILDIIKRELDNKQNKKEEKNNGTRRS
jgi:hypothetical protein